MSRLQIGSLVLEHPVMLSPMAGVTNAPFRRMCREFGPGMLYVCEMVGARSLVLGDEKSRHLAHFPDDESPRSIQLYGTDPGSIGEAVAFMVSEERADHIDLNFGCPVPKVTRNGGGAVLPWRIHVLRAIIKSAVANAGSVPITVKLRKGIDPDHLTYLQAGRVAQEEGASGVALHARTAEELYSGNADWPAIRRLKEELTEIPVLGNGDIWEATDAVRMMEETGCDGVVVGRGCLGRPWLFADLVAVLNGLNQLTVPRFGFVAEVMVKQCRLLIEWSDEFVGTRTFRKHAGWYLKGYPVGPDFRSKVSMVESLRELESLVAAVDPETLPRPGATRMPRGHTRGPRPVKVPYGYLDEEWDKNVPSADEPVSGG